MVKKLLLFSTILLITILPNVNVNAVSFSTNGYTCVNFLNGNQYCSNVRQFDYDNIPYFGADFSYSPDNLEEISTTVVDFRNQSFCPNNSSGGFLNFRFYHNYAFTNSVLSFMQASVNGKNYLCSSSLSQDGRYSEVSCPIASGFSDQTLTFSYKINDLSFNFPFTAGFSNLLLENCNISTGDIINSQNQNTQDIINNNNTNSQNIINNNTNNTNQIIQDNQQNTQDIIDNQNSNTDKEIESQKVCSIYGSNYATISGNLVLDGSIGNDPAQSISDFINIQNSNIILLDRASKWQNVLCFYNKDKVKIQCNTQNDFNIGDNIPIPTNSFYFRYTIIKNEGKPQYKICTNGNQALNDSFNNLNDTLNSDTPPDTENEISDLESDLISDTPITDLITLPISLINSYINGFSSSCSPYNLGNLLGTDLILPCLNLQQRLGSNLWTIIDSLFSIFMIYNIAMLMVHAFEGFTSLRDDYEGLYQPRHADTGYEPKHGGGN